MVTVITSVIALSVAFAYMSPLHSFCDQNIQLIQAGSGIVVTLLTLFHVLRYAVSWSLVDMVLAIIYNVWAALSYTWPIVRSSEWISMYEVVVIAVEVLMGLFSLLILTILM